MNKGRPLYSTLSSRYFTTRHTLLNHCFTLSEITIKKQFSLSYDTYTQVLKKNQTLIRTWENDLWCIRQRNSIW